ncbi:MAG: hypothetical protein L6R41_006276 [Letrouitia leprolyta]|nr:MAG: hypothetical protein L6R41_006276 [Letrouitia leprolyta]
MIDDERSNVFAADPRNCNQATIEVRILAAIPRSGSTLFMRIFREAAECAVTSRLVLMGNHGVGRNFRPDYTIFHNLEALAVYRDAKRAGKSKLISKEELGHECWKGECDYQIFPDRVCAQRTRPAFLFRDPLRVFDSWKAVGWTDIDSLVVAYRHLYHTWAACGRSAIAIVYEELTNHPYLTVERLCHHWGIEFTHNLLTFHHPFGEFLYGSERERRIYSVDNPLGLFNTVQSNQTINADIRSHGLLTTEEKERIERSIGGIYMDMFGKRINAVRDTLLQKTHFGFDLDDTLHEFRRASGAASASVFTYLSVHNTATFEELKDTYAEILAKTTSGAFVEGKSSEDYRTERFTALMQAHSIEVTKEILQNLLSLYKNSLRSALTLKSGAQELLLKLKRLGKQVILVTEGPEDAQIWTVEELGIADKVDVTITSNKFGMTKTDGLFGVVLKELGVGAKDFVFIGDNMTRDILPAREAGIMAVHYSESENIRLDIGELRLNSLWKLSRLLARSDDQI